MLELHSLGRGKILPAADDWLEVPTQAPENLATRVAALAARGRR